MAKKGVNVATLCVRLPDELNDRFIAFQRRSRLTRSQIVRCALELGLNQLVKNPRLILGDLDPEALPPVGEETDLSDFAQRLRDVSDEFHDIVQRYHDHLEDNPQAAEAEKPARKGKKGKGKASAASPAT
jgi:predicted DNA-binding protein